MIDFEDALAAVQLPEWVLKKPSLAERMRLWRAGWIMNARPKQHVDFGAIHRDTILFHPGRGWGKTEVLNQWMSWDLLFWPGMIGHVVAATHNDTRYTVMEGPTGVLSLVPRELIADYNKTDSIVVFEGGSKLRGFSSEEPERLRGPQCAILGCDELAAWKSDRETWQQARFGHRLRHPQYGRSLAVVTTTPKPKALIQEMFKDPTILKIGGDTKENEQNLSETFMKDMERLRGTRLGRQELAGELLEAEELGVIKRSQWKQFPVGAKIPPLDLVIMSLDTAFTEENVDVENQDQDYTACTVWGCYREKLANGEYEPRIILLWAWQERLGFPDLVERVRKDREKTYGNYEMRGVVTPMFGFRGPAMKTGRKADMVLIEDKGSGISLRQTLRRSGIPVIPYNPGKADKYLRLNLTAPLFVAGYVYAPQSENHPEEFKSWAEPLVGQMCAYAGEDSLEHEDLMDSATQALLWIDRNWLRNLPPKYATREQAMRSDWRVQGRGNPYAR